MNNTKSTPRKNKSEEYVFIEKTSSSKDGKNPRFIFAKTEDIKNKIDIQNTKDMSFFSRIKFLFSGKKMREKEKLADEIRINKMRTDAADQIQKILERPDFKKVRGAEELLKDIKESKSVKSEDLRRVLNSAAFEGIRAFPITDATSQESSLEDDLRDSLHAKFTALDNLYLISQEDKSSQDSIKRNITFAWGEVKEENKPSNKYKIKAKAKAKAEKIPTETGANSVQNKPQRNFKPKKIINNDNQEVKNNNDLKEFDNNDHKININQNSPGKKTLPEHLEKEINSDTAEKTNSKITPEKTIKTNTTQVISKQNKSKLEIEKNELKAKIALKEKNDIENSSKIKFALSVFDLDILNVMNDVEEQYYIEKESKIREIQKNTNQEEIKKEIDLQIIKLIHQDEKLNRNIAEGLNELISHINNPKKICDLKGNEKIATFIDEIKYLEAEIKEFPLKLSIQITDLHTWYAEKYAAARAKGSILEFNKIMHPKLGKSATDEEQKKLAAELNNELSSIYVFASDKNALSSFIKYCENPEGGFDKEMQVDYDRFLDIFYKNINDLTLMARSQCLNMADRLEGHLEELDGDGLNSFDFDYWLSDKPEALKLANSLKEYKEPSSSLLIFLDYMIRGKISINQNRKYWQLIQFTVNQERNIISFLDLNSNIATFQRVLVELREDLKKYKKEELN